MLKLLKTHIPSYIFSCFIASIMLWAFQADAQIYQWTDDQGRRSFTDDPSNIPFKHQRSMKKMYSAAPKASRPISSRESEKKEKKEEEGKKASPFSKSTSKEEEENKLSPEETGAMKEAIGFLKADIKRYESYIDKPLDLQIDQVVRGALEKKTALAKKLSAFDQETLKETAAFLNASAKKDEDAKNLSPNPIIRKARAVKRRDRAKAENKTKTSLIEKLEKALSPPEPSEEPKK